MSVEELVKQARYYVGNPSAWEAYDEGASEIIRSVVNKLKELELHVRHADAYLQTAQSNIQRAKKAEAALAEKDKEIAALREALEDAMAGMRYVRQVYGDLSGVGFDRVEERGRKALARNAGGKDGLGS